jgi:UDP-2-acetamido-3-amino-2,3-dideoxy-glucuronate N-acetyltransferase
MGEKPEKGNSENLVIGNNIIHESFIHGTNFKIGNFCVIEEGVCVGNNVTIGNYVLLKKGTFVEDNVFIDSYVRSSGDNSICKGSTIRFGATIARNVVVGNNVFISPNVMTIYTTHEGKKEKKMTVIADEAFIGTAAVIGPGITIGKKVVIGAMTYVTKDCLEKGIYFGIPAKKIR